MDIETALAPPEGSLSEATIAVVGAGGKKTTLYTLAGRLQRAVVTASVRIPIFDPQVTTLSVSEEPVAELETVEEDQFPLGLVPKQERDDRYLGYDPTVVDEIVAAHDGPVLIKADGARSREFKAPDEREPQIPASTDIVVPIASVDAVGEPLTDVSIHRPEQVVSVAREAGIHTGVGEPVTPEIIGTVLASETGGLKDIPADATPIPLINKVDTEADASLARDIAAVVHEQANVDRVILASMRDGSVTDSVTSHSSSGHSS